MEEKFIIDEELRSKILRSLIQQEVQACQIDALKMVLAGIYSKMDPRATLKIQDDAYKSLVLAIFESRMTLLKEHNQAYSDEITEQMRSLLKEMPGIVLPPLTKNK